MNGLMFLTATAGKFGVTICPFCFLSVLVRQKSCTRCPETVNQRGSQKVGVYTNNIVCTDFKLICLYYCHVRYWLSMSYVGVFFFFRLIIAKGLAIFGVMFLFTVYLRCLCRTISSNRQL